MSGIDTGAGIEPSAVSPASAGPDDPSGPAAAGDRRAAGRGTQIAALAGANLRAWTRDPGIVVQSLVFPGFMLLMFELVFGKTIGQTGGGDSIYGYTALVSLVGALYGAVATTLALVQERESGLLSRMWTLPVARFGFVAGRIGAEALRSAISTIVLFAIGMALGLRFGHGLLGALGALAIPVVFAVGVAVPIMALATVSNGQQAVQLLGGIFLFLLFFNSGFAPIDEFPGWLQPFVEAQPMSPAIEAMRGLTEGGPILVPVLQSIAWSAGLVAVFGPLAIRGYRKAAEGR